MTPKTITATVQESKKLAEVIAKTIQGGEVFALIGGLGTGKTTFTQHLAKALGYRGKVTSPTFTLLKIYKVKIGRQKSPLYIHHFDLYRLETESELAKTGLLESLGKPDAITLVEWADKSPKLAKQATTTINFTHL